MSENCDIEARLEDRQKPGKELYGKKMLTSHRPYNMWNEDTDEFNMEAIESTSIALIWNMCEAAICFETKLVDVDELITASKGLIWDWTSQEELERTAESIEKTGLWFPIFVLPKGKLHNQIASEDELKVLSAKGLYNAYNGNHRIDALQWLKKQGRWNKKVLVYIIPEFCQKSCTGFKYDPIDDKEESYLTQWKLPNELFMVHLNHLEHEMKVTNWRRSTQVPDAPGESIVIVDNYNVAFRLMTEVQNALEPVLTRYYELNGTLPDTILQSIVLWNDEEASEKLRGLYELHNS